MWWFVAYEERFIMSSMLIDLKNIYSVFILFCIILMGVIQNTHTILYACYKWKLKEGCVRSKTGVKECQIVWEVQN